MINMFLALETIIMKSMSLPYCSFITDVHFGVIIL